jgi:hypothetical protein
VEGESNVIYSAIAESVLGDLAALERLKEKTFLAKDLAAHIRVLGELVLKDCAIACLHLQARHEGVC